MDLKDLLQLPKLEECKSILCIQPHPDDNEVGAGGTIAKLSKLGCKITYLTVTDGSMGTIDAEQSKKELAQIRQSEIKASADILGVSGLLSLNYKDGTFLDEMELCRKIVSVIREVKPEFVMTVDPFLPYEVHPDHRRVGMAAAQASLFSVFPHFHSYGEAHACKNIWPVKCLAFYNTAYPNTFIDVDTTWNQKIASISAHKSQFFGEEFEQLKMYFEFKSAQLAKDRGFSHAEAFKVLTPQMLHANVDAINM